MKWKGSKVLVTGSEGMIGEELVIQLEKLGANITHFDIKFGSDITNSEDLDMIFNNYGPFDCVFSLFGVKGNPKMTKERPVDFMAPMLIGDSLIIKKSQDWKVKRFLYTSSIAVENPETDKYPAWAKMTGETLIEAMRIQYPKGTKYCIVRPSNCYGRFDNFFNPNAMVVTSLISKGVKEGRLTLYKEGSKQIRDLINAKDVARGMIKCMEEMPQNPVNLCSGKGVSIKEVADIICEELDIGIAWTNSNMVLGPQKKVMSNPYIKPEVSLKDGIKECIEYVRYKNTI
jgi:nucleoside-diphosphate-sugar epimerase